jgi:hypothetical protein
MSFDLNTIYRDDRALLSISRRTRSDFEASS